MPSIMNEERPIPGHTTVKLENTGEQREESKHFQTRGTKDREWKWHRLSQQPLWKLKFYTRADCQEDIFSDVSGKNFASLAHFLRKLLEDMHDQIKE